MFESFDSSSTQNFINVFYSTAVSGGTEIKVTDKSGNVVLSYTPTNDFTAVILSSDKLVTGESYTVSAGSNSEEITISAGENSIGSQSGGMGFGGGNGTPPSGLPGKMAVHLAETALWDSHLRSRQMPMEINWLCRSHQAVREIIVKATNVG